MHIIILDPFTSVPSKIHLEGVVFYHAHDGLSPSDCMWIMPGTLNLND